MNSSNPSIADDIRTYISTELIIGTMAIDDNQELLMSGLLDSINVMRLVGYLENEFSTSIPPEDVLVENFGSINQIVDYLQVRTNDSNYAIPVSSNQSSTSSPVS